jgi:hypothetical protein
MAQAEKKVGGVKRAQRVKRRPRAPAGGSAHRASALGAELGAREQAVATDPTERERFGTGGAAACTGEEGLQHDGGSEQIRRHCE